MWRTLSEECRDAFLAVFAEEVTRDRMSSNAVRVAQTQVELPIEDLLPRRNRVRRFRRDARRQLSDRGVQFAGRRHAIDEADFVGALGADDLTGEEHLHG